MKIVHTVCDACLTRQSCYEESNLCLCIDIDNCEKRIRELEERELKYEYWIEDEYNC